MIIQSLNRTGCQESARSSPTGHLFRSRHRGDDATERIARLTKALRSYGYDVQQTLLAGPEDITWID